MSLPYLNRIQKRTSVISTFGGLNQKLVIGNNEFSDMKNISYRNYPALSSRENRGEIIASLDNPNGIYYKNGLFYVDGTSCYYNDEEITGLTVENSEKQLVGIGAYIVIFPDKILYNTYDGSVKRMEASLSGKPVTVSPLSDGSSFAKVEADGIDDVFNVADNVTFEGFTDDLETLNGTKIITDKGDDFLVVSYLIAESVTQETGASFARRIPDMDYVAELDNRLWGCSSANHEIYASKLGDPCNWNNFEGIASDSFVATVGSDGDFTGCIAHLGYMIFFKEHTIHIMYGTKPANYQLNTKTLPGVKKGCERSMQIVNETLFYVGVDGVYSYDGATPSKISDKITENITDAVSCQQNCDLYISCKLDGVQSVLVFDPKIGVWSIEDDDEFLHAFYGNGVLYYIDKNKSITTINGSRNERIEWFVESGDLTESSMDNKYISMLKYNIMLGRGSEANIFIKFDDEPIWRKKGTIYATRNDTYTIPIIPDRCNKYRYRIEGKGQFRIFGVAMDVEGGSEIHGYSQSKCNR